MSERNFELYLTDILESGRAIQSYVQGIEFKGFADDRMRYTAAIREFEIIGEAAYQLSQETRASMPEAPWEDIIGMRHRLVHAYFDINLDILWQTIEQDLPALIPVLEALVPPEES